MFSVPISNKLIIHKSRADFGKVHEAVCLIQKGSRLPLKYKMLYI